MIRHIVLWKLHEQAEGNTKEKNMDYVISELLEIQKEFPLLRDLKCHKSIPQQGDYFWDLVLEMTFDSFDDMQKYQVYPRHKKLHEFAVKVRTDRAVADYEV
ncbi:stress responsive protein [Synergistales bacterium]|nr:stress responsive protein [Synergistales bacterium]